MMTKVEMKLKLKMKMKKANRTKASLRLSSCLIFNRMKMSSPTAYWQYRQTGYRWRYRDIPQRQARTRSPKPFDGMNPANSSGLRWLVSPWNSVQIIAPIARSEGKIEGAQPHPHPLSDIGVPTEKLVRTVARSGSNKMTRFEWKAKWRQ